MKNLNTLSSKLTAFAAALAMNGLVLGALASVAQLVQRILRRPCRSGSCPRMAPASQRRDFDWPSGRSINPRVTP